MSDKPGPSTSSGAVYPADFESLFAVMPLPSCPHLEQVKPLPKEGLDALVKCGKCDSLKENWACLTCYEVNCGRHIELHAMEHAQSTDHPMVLSFADLSVWCYPCEDYVHHQVLLPAKNAAHVSKFGSEIGK